jgi:hypothetical protein
MIKVFPIRHTMFAARHLVTQLNLLGVDALLVDKIERGDKSIYIIYNAAGVAVLPKRYIVMQTEIAGSHWFTWRYMNTLKNALCIWEYNEDNISAYKHVHKKIAVVSPGICPQQGAPSRDISILFYGWVQGSERREKMLKELVHTLPVGIITNKLENEIWDLLRRTQVVINLHYYDNSPLELFRINEALSFGCEVVSEGCSEKYSMVHFAKGVEEIIAQTRAALMYREKPDLSCLDNLEEIKNGLKLINL